MMGALFDEKVGRGGAAGASGSDGGSRLGHAWRRRSAAELAGEAPEVASGERLATYLRLSVFDFLLLLVISACLAMTASFAFESVPDIRGNALVVGGLCIPQLVILFFGGSSRRAVLPAVVLSCIWVAILIAGACLLTAPVPLFADGALNDVAESYLPFAVVVAVVPLLAFLLSRHVVGMAFLLLGSVLTCSWVQFLFRDWADNHGLAISLALYIALGMLFVYQTYRSSVMSAKRVKKTSFVGVLAYAAGIVAVCAGVAAAVFFFAIQPAGLQTFDLRPFQRYYAIPVVEYSPVFDKQQVESPDDTTDQTNDEMKDSSDNAEGGPNQDQSEDPQANPLSPVQQFMSQFDPDSWSQQFDGVNYDQLRLGTLIAVLFIALAVAAAVCARRSVRERRLRRWEGLSPSQQVSRLYAFFNGRFGKMKVERPEALTPMEFALGSQRRLAQFAEGTGGVDFVRVTDIYQRTCFGGHKPTEEELSDVKAYYRAFFANARRYLGNVRWLWKFWRI